MREVEALDWGVVAPHAVNPTKVSIVEALRWIDQPLSASELELIFDRAPTLATISYHLTSLAAAGVLQQVSKRQVRGAWESHYCLAAAVRQPT